MPRRLLVALLAGAAMVPAFAPFEWFPLALAALAVLVHLWLAAPGPRAAAALGFAFGMGMFLVGVSWVYISLHRYGAMPAPLAAIASVGFCAILAAYAALAGALQAKFRVPPALRAALVIPALWTLGEWLRATLFTGFPWLSLGTAALDTPLAGLAPLGGVYAVSLAAASAAGLLWCVATGQARWAAAAAFAILGVTGAVLRQFEWTVPAGAPFAANLVQGNVPQDLKFDPARYARTLEVHARLAEASGARLIVLPETAVPRMLDSVDPAYLERLRAAAVAQRRRPAPRCAHAPRLGRLLQQRREPGRLALAALPQAAPGALRRVRAARFRLDRARAADPARRLFARRARAAAARGRRSADRRQHLLRGCLRRAS